MPPCILDAITQLLGLSRGKCVVVVFGLSVALLHSCAASPPSRNSGGQRRNDRGGAYRRRPGAHPYHGMTLRVFMGPMALTNPTDGLRKVLKSLTESLESEASTECEEASEADACG